jgi:hypothetical protein
MHLDAIRQQGDHRWSTETHPARQRRLRHRRLTATITKPSFIGDEQATKKKKQELQYHFKFCTLLLNFVLLLYIMENKKFVSKFLAIFAYCIIYDHTFRFML